MFSERIVERQLHDLEEEASKLADRVTAALVIYVEHMKDHHERLKLMFNMAWAKNQYNDTKGKNLPNHWGEVDAPLQCFGMEQDSLKEDDGVVVGVMEEHGWRNGHEKRPKEKLRTRQDRSLRNRVVQFTNGAAQGGARTCRSATDSVHCSL